MHFEKKHLLLYAVTDRSSAGRQAFLERIADAISGGVTMLQLREKELNEDIFLKEAVKVTELCHKYRIPCIINDNVNIALKSGADGVHVGIYDTPVKEIRKRAGRNFIIGATAKTKEQAKLAEESGADYLGAGAVFPSPTKTNAVRITTEQLSDICSSVSIPVVAIGGITASNIDALKGSGICGIAAVSSVFAADDVKAAAGQLRKKAASLAEKPRKRS